MDTILLFLKTLNIVHLVNYFNDTTFSQRKIILSFKKISFDFKVLGPLLLLADWLISSQ